MKYPKPTKLSELIKQLQGWKRKYGDLPVFLDANSVDWRVDEEFSLEVAGARLETVRVNPDSSRTRKAVVFECQDKERKYAYITDEERSYWLGEEQAS